MKDTVSTPIKLSDRSQLIEIMHEQYKQASNHDRSKFWRVYDAAILKAVKPEHLLSTESFAQFVQEMIPQIEDQTSLSL